jgi:hypothetical protein
VNQPCDITLTASDPARKWRLLASANLLHFLPSISPISDAVKMRGGQALLHGTAKITFPWIRMRHNPALTRFNFCQAKIILKKNIMKKI